MKKTGTLLFVILCIQYSIELMGQSTPCVNCYETINNGKESSAIGIRTETYGSAAFSSGYQSIAQGDYATALGFQAKALGTASIAAGYDAIANGKYSVSLGLETITGHMGAVAIGFGSEADNVASIAIGKNIKTIAPNAITFGSGYGSQMLENSFQGTMMIGFNSILPTFFISRSPAGGDKTGKIGIGNITAPLAKLHIKADATENATLFLQPSDWDNKYAELSLGTSANSIKAAKDVGLSFETEKDFLFNDGNVGIGTSQPLHPLQVNGNLMISSQDGSLLFSGDNEGGWGEWGIEYSNGGLNFWKPYGSNNSGNYFLFLADDGDVGIGTSTPSAKLDVNGNVLQSPGFHIASSQIIAPDINGLKLTDQNGVGIFLKEGGNVGIGTATIDPEAKLEVAGNIKVNGLKLVDNNQGSGKLLQSDDEGNAEWVDPPPTDDGDWVINGNDVYRDGGNVGIGTDVPNARLDVAGNINAESINVTGLQLVDNNQAPGKLLQSDDEGNASWADPPPTDDGDWVISSNGINVSREGGKVGIGTGTPSSNLHINSDEANNITTTFLTIENDGVDVYGSGITTVGKMQGNGPVIIQKAGIGPNFSDGGPRLAILQKSKNDINGLSISTYTTNDGQIDRVDIYGESSYLVLRAKDDLNFRTENGNINFATAPNITQRMQINAQGQVGIGTTTHIDQDFTRLTVAGRIHAQEVKVNTSAGADFVFDKEYNLPDISDIENYIQSNKHLPGIPSAEEMQQNGIDLGEMQIKLLQKIEELTLYLIALKKENEEMKLDNEKMKAEIENLKSK